MADSDFFLTCPKVSSIKQPRRTAVPGPNTTDLYVAVRAKWVASYLCSHNRVTSRYTIIMNISI